MLRQQTPPPLPSNVYGDVHVELTVDLAVRQDADGLNFCYPAVPLRAALSARQAPAPFRVLCCFALDLLPAVCPLTGQHVLYLWGCTAWPQVPSVCTSNNAGPVLTVTGGCWGWALHGHS